jgi:hypothetical protein
VSEWFRGVIEGVYVGTPSKGRSKAIPVDVSPYDIRLYRASVSAVEVISDPDAAAAAARGADAASVILSTEPASDTAKATDTTAEETERTAPAAEDVDERAAENAGSDEPPGLRQAELQDVTFLGVGSDLARDHHAAFDIRITDVELLGSTEHQGKVYGRLVGNVVGRITPPRPSDKEAIEQRKRARERAESVGVWVESLRWVMVVVVAWMCYGACGVATGTLWTLVILPAAMAYGLSRNFLSNTHGPRVFGWFVVVAGLSLAAMLQYRLMREDCSTVIWWVTGITGAMFVSAILPSRYPFLWTKITLAATLLSLCGERAEPCAKDIHKYTPAVINQAPRLGPDGRWPRSPKSRESD